jgi:surface polysaccharide O-acyltransferase-like enzyme
LKKAAVWALIAGLCHLIAPTFAPGFYPSWYFALSAIAYGLLLPVIASLHVRHEPLRKSGAVLGTIAGASVVTLGLGAAASIDLIPAALFVRGIWWWTIGKMWAETGVLPRVFGWITAALAIACFALVAAYAVTGIPMAPPDLPLRLILGLWLIVLAAFLWRDAR